MIIRFKSLDRLQTGETSLLDIGNGLGISGMPLKEKIHELFAKAKIHFLPTVSFSKEEIHKYNLQTSTKKEKDKLLSELVQKDFYSNVHRYRDNLFQRTINSYIPYEEKPEFGKSHFKEKNKTQFLNKNELFKSNQNNIEQNASLIGSINIITPQNLSYYKQMIEGLSKNISALKTAEIKDRNYLPKLFMHSVRLQSQYDGRKRTTTGDALAWHAVDTTTRFLYTILNINKDRVERQCQLSSDRIMAGRDFDPRKEIQYQTKLIEDTALGILLHAIGLAHTTIHETIATKLILDKNSLKDETPIKLIRENLNVTQNLLRNRDDIPSTSKQVYRKQNMYPNGTGFPKKGKHEPLSELIRLFHIVDIHDELINPIFNETPYGRMDAIEYLKSISGIYEFNPLEFTPSAKLDSNLLEEHLKMYKPYPEGEIVHIYPRNDRSRPHYTGVVQTYKKDMSPIPIISIVKDYHLNKNYRIGQKLFDIENGDEYTFKEKNHVRNLKPELKEFIIHDIEMNPGDISKYQDIYFSDKREVSVKTQSKRRFT